MVVIALIFLLIFGPSKMPEMARDIGKFVGQARGAIDEFKNELTAETGADELKSERPTRKREERGHEERRHRERDREGQRRGGDQDARGRDGSGGTGEQNADHDRETAEYDL